MPRTAMARSAAARETALLIPEATPTRLGETAPMTVVVSGATLTAMPMPNTAIAGKIFVQ